MPVTALSGEVHAVNDLTVERATALALAVQLHQTEYLAEGGDPHKVTATASVLWDFLTGPVALLITAGPGADQTTGKPTGNPGGTSMVALKDNEKVQLTVTALDAKGQVTASGADVTFTSSDETVLTITNDDTGVWAVAGNPGSAVVTADWPDSPAGDIQGTEAFDVTAGDATSLVVTSGDPVPQ
jgi:hypothetical protein